MTDPIRHSLLSRPAKHIEKEQKILLSCRLPTLRLGQPTWAVSPPVGCYYGVIKNWIVVSLGVVLRIYPSHISAISNLYFPF